MTIRAVSLLFSLFLFAMGSESEKGAAAADRFVRNMHVKKNISMQRKMPKGYEYLTDLIKTIETEKPLLTISYLTSSSVPVASHLGFSRSMRKLTDTMRVDGRMCMRGIEGGNFESFAMHLMTKLDEDGDDSLGLELCPELFEDLNITRVPTYVISVCSNKHKHIEECTPKYFIGGDASLRFMMEKLSEENPYFKDLYEAL
jgi:hypothetical protein